MDQIVIDKFMNNIQKLDSGCWIWTGGKNPNGFGVFYVDRYHLVQAHRFIFLVLQNLSIPSEIDVNHLCNEKLCVNPEHLEIQYLEARFWKFVDRRGEDDCWEWKGTLRGGSTGDRYGGILIDGVSHSAHRTSYELFVGKIDDGMFVLHSCDNTKCVNPKHLHLGSHSDNMREASERNRMAKGSANKNSKLSEDDVREIKMMVMNKSHSYSQISSIYGIGRSTVKDIVSGRCWGWVKLNE